MYYGPGETLLSVLSPAQTPGPRTRLFSFDQFELDLDAFELRRDGLPLALEPQVIEVLAVLIENEGRVVTKDELFDRVWPERYVSEAALNSRVMSARKALGDSGQQQRYIKTVHGRGYRFLGRANPARESVVIPFPAAGRRVEGPSAPATPFIGRGEEVAALQSLLSREECRLVTVCGPGGAGKTRLLMKLHAEAPQGWESRFISLEQSAPGTLAASVACGLGAQAGTGAAEDQILRAVGNRACTLYLDNIELLADEARLLFATLLEDAPALRIVCTSRVALNIQREWLFRLDGMSPDDACELFIDRSARARGGRPVAAEDPAISAICEITGRLPLAVELAAGLTAYLEPRAILAQIERDAACLSTSLHDVPDRHRSLVALFEESCGRLSPGDREALTACAVFAGPFDAASARAVAACDLASVMRLVDGSLLQAHNGRFRMHPLLRQLVLAAAGDELDAIRATHGEYFMALLARSAVLLEGSDQLDVLETLSADFSNVSAAWEWAAAEERIDLLGSTHRGLIAYLMRGHYARGDAMARAGADAARSRGDLGVLSPLLVSRSWFLLRMGRIGEASAALTEALSIARSLALPWRPGYGADPRLAAVMFRVGAGDYARAFSQAINCRDLALEAGDRTGAAFACWLAGMALLRQATLVCDETHGIVRYAAAPGDTLVVESAEYLAEAQSLLPAGEHYLSAAVAVESGVQNEYAGRDAAAIGQFRRSYALRSALGDARGVGTALFYLADVLLNERRVGDAIPALEEAEEHFRRLGDSAGMAEVTRVRGIARLTAGGFAGARSALIESLRRSLALGFANNVAGLMRTYSDLLAAEGQLEAAADVLRAVLADPTTTPASVARAHSLLGRLARQGVVPPQSGPTTTEMAADLVRGAELDVLNEIAEVAV